MSRGDDWVVKVVGCNPIGFSHRWFESNSSQIISFNFTENTNIIVQDSKIDFFKSSIFKKLVWMSINVNIFPKKLIIKNLKNFIQITNYLIFKNVSFIGVFFDQIKILNKNFYSAPKNKAFVIFGPVSVKNYSRLQSFKSSPVFKSIMNFTDLNTHTYPVLVKDDDDLSSWLFYTLTKNIIFNALFFKKQYSSKKFFFLFLKLKKFL